MPRRSADSHVREFQTLKRGLFRRVKLSNAIAPSAPLAQWLAGFTMLHISTCVNP